MTTAKTKPKGPTRSVQMNLRIDPQLAEDLERYRAETQAQEQDPEVEWNLSRVVRALLRDALK